MRNVIVSAKERSAPVDPFLTSDRPFPTTVVGPLLSNAFLQTIGTRGVGGRIGLHGHKKAKSVVQFIQLAYVSTFTFGCGWHCQHHEFTRTFTSSNQ